MRGSGFFRERGKRHGGPDDDRNGQQDRARLLDIHPGPLPAVQQDAQERGHAVGGKLHDKGRRLALDDGRPQQTRHHQGKNPSSQHDAEHDGGRVFRKKRAGQQQEDRQLGAAGHVGQREQGGKLFLGAAQGARGHGAGDGATARNAA